MAVRLDAISVEAVPTIAFHSAREVKIGDSDLAMLRGSLDGAARWHPELKWSILLPVPSSSNKDKCAGVLRLEGLASPPTRLLEGGLIEDHTVNIILRRLGAQLSGPTLQRTS